MENDLRVAAIVALTQGIQAKLEKRKSKSLFILYKIPGYRWNISMRFIITVHTRSNYHGI